GGPDLQQLAAKLYLDTEYLQSVEWLLKDRKQVVFFGPPGTGKTYVARKFADWFTGSPDRVKMLQFHPTYSYEDFVEGIRPILDSERLIYRNEPGPMRSFAELAEAS